MRRRDDGVMQYGFDISVLLRARCQGGTVEGPIIMLSKLDYTGAQFIEKWAGIVLPCHVLHISFCFS